MYYSHLTESLSRNLLQMPVITPIRSEVIKLSLISSICNKNYFQNESQGSNINLGRLGNEQNLNQLSHSQKFNKTEKYEGGSCGCCFCLRSQKKLGGNFNNFRSSNIFT